jgi:hypothetical protein
MCLDIPFQQGNPVGIVARSWAGRSRFRITVRVRIFSFSKVQPGSGMRPTSYSVDAVVLSQSYSGRGRDLDHCPASNAEVKNEWSYSSTATHTSSWCGKGKIFLSNFSSYLICSFVSGRTYSGYIL